jgi:hypothetical protein
VKTLATARAIKITEDRTIDIALLFQRFLVVSQSVYLNLSEVMEYELSPYPSALFEAKDRLRKPDKAHLVEAIRNYVTPTSDDAVLETIPVTDHYVLDGGSLLHRLKWTEGSTYSSIANAYAKFTLDLYGHATVVFGGYSGGPGIKDITHQRRGANKTANKVNISDATKFVGKKEDFLSNVENKQAMIDLIAKCLKQKGCHVIQAEEDADVDIVKAAVSMSGYKSTTLNGEDTDLLILLLYHATLKDSHELYFRSDKTGDKTKQYVYNINDLKQMLGQRRSDKQLASCHVSSRPMRSRYFPSCYLQNFDRKICIRRKINREKY